ncbi:MAG: DUF5702 domain-containing protein [Clostridiaceae bacterium]|nr:DUF5702 domain-containing protein [Clostridiaceae bacterium]
MGYVDKRKQGSGSITVFLACVFLLFYSLIGVAWEHVRIVSAAGYLQTAAAQAAMVTFGDYNKELYEEYGLFAYGGYDGIGTAELTQQFLDTLQENIKAVPDNSLKQYIDLYRFYEVDASVSQTKCLTDREEFCRQVSAFLKAGAVKNLTEGLLEQVSGTGQTSVADENLSIARDYEEGKYDSDGELSAENSADTTEGQEAVSQKPSDEELQESLKEDAAGGNPLDFFSDLMRDGILNLVCDAESLSEETIEPLENAQTQENQNEEEEQTSQELGAAQYLQDFIDTEEGEIDTGLLQAGTEKSELICYANQQFGNYTKEKKHAAHYEVEYLAAGKEEEKDNLSYVVNRLLVTRMLINFGTIVMDAALQEKSLATATVIAGFTCMPPVITAVQYTILLVLAFQESCVDLAALLAGKEVPLLKTVTELKMSYEEICLGGKELFRQKASEYPDADGKLSSTGISYIQYLWVLLALQSRDELVQRSCTLIQSDLRQRYNQSFYISAAVCQADYSVNYQMGYTFGQLPLIKGLRTDGIQKNLEVHYEYKSG